MSAFTSRLEILKSKKHIMQKDVSVALNISLRTYQRYEYGEREPSMSTLIALADFFDVSLDYLVGRSDNPDRRWPTLPTLALK